jgi:hypothetical protein
MGCDFQTSFQQIVILDESPGELIERRLDLQTGEAEAFYRDLRGPVRVGIEATGAIRWFERLLAELDHELWIGRVGQPLTCRVPHPCGFCRGADFDFASFISAPATLTSL